MKHFRPQNITKLTKKITKNRPSRKKKKVTHQITLNTANVTEKTAELKTTFAIHDHCTALRT